MMESVSTRSKNNLEQAPILHRRWNLPVWASAAAALAALVAAASIGPYRYSIWPPTPPTRTARPAATAEGGTTADAGKCSCEPPSNATFPSLAAEAGLSGNVSDCCCSFADIERTNLDTVRPLLERIVATPFFSHFKVDLCSDCPLWDDAPLCVLRDCGVCECDEPPVWAAGVQGLPPTGPAHGMIASDIGGMSNSRSSSDCVHVGDNVIVDVDSRISDGWEPSAPAFLGGRSPPISNINDGNDDSMSVVVDLRLNPERFTGYSGPSAAKVWSAIHSTNCFQPATEQEKGGGREEASAEEKEEGEDPTYCLLPAEQRIYNRVISGLHSSISLHIAHSYCTEMDPDRIGECRTWGHNADLARERVLDHSDRLENLYVAFALLLRAVVKAGPAVAAAVPREDALYADGLSEWTDSLLPEIARLARVCPRTFDEAGLFAGPGLDSMRSELQHRFGHLQQIMQCVGCDRCKLWGTLQTLGVGTALRVLFHGDEAGGERGALSLTRQEAVALVHTLERFSSALFYAHDLKRDASIGHEF